MATRIAAWGALAAALLAGGSAGAQLLPGPPVVPTLPDVGGTVERVGRIGDDALDRVGEGLPRDARRLLDLRADRLRDLVRTHPDRLEMTDEGPAVRGEVIAIDPDPATLVAVREAGFEVLAQDDIEGLGLAATRLRPPRRWSVERALSRLRRIAPEGEFAANHLHLPSGGAAAVAAGSAALAQGEGAVRASVGIVDGGVAAHPALTGRIRQRGFASGAPRASAHGTAVASLVAGTRPVRGAAPGVSLLAADIYGRDPAGGNALALARALGWLTASGVKVAVVSLVGPSNPLVARAVEAARRRGLHIVAAVGNDGPAAPLAYPASYPGVIAVTGVDARGRVLIEAGRARNLDYAAPGADMAAARPGGGLAAVRGTSYAVPLVAGRLAAHLGAADPIAALDREAEHRGRRGYGRGLVCGPCRTPVAR
jgi:hypothetical protein